MRENIEIATNFAKQLDKRKGILQIVLFGSVARGEDTFKSDVDIAIIHTLSNIEPLKKEIQKYLHEKIQLTYLHKDQLSRELEILSALTGEGILLYGKPIQVKVNKKELKPYILLIYNTTAIDKKKRMLLNRALYGSISRSMHKEKKYKTETKGLVAQPGIIKLTHACLLLEPRKAHSIRSCLRRFDTSFTEELIWK